MKRDLQTALVLGLALWAIAYGAGMSKPPGPATKAERDRVIAAVASLGWPPAEVNAVISVESGWNPAARNPDGDASGLIQFMPATLKILGFAPELSDGRAKAAAMRQLGADEQLPWILKFFRNCGKTWKVPGDTYLVVAAPGYVGAPDSTIVYPVGSAAWKSNPALRSDDGGPITAGSIRRVILRKL